MARKAVYRFMVEATFQSPSGYPYEATMELEAHDSQQIWEACEKMAEEDDEELIYATIKKLNTDTGEAITVRPKKETAPPRQRWYESDTFIVKNVGVSPCMYKAED